MCEAYLGDCLCFRCRRIAHLLNYYIARFFLGTRAADKARCSVRNGFDHEVECKACVIAEIFFDSVQIVFRLDFAEHQKLDEFAKEMAVLLMDNCPSLIVSDVM
jgi:hypothetical protein